MTPGEARPVDARIERLRDHFIICAYGRVGRTVARELEGEGMPFVAIERQEELIPEMESDGVLRLTGDPTTDGVLQAAGIDRARALISAVDSDADNVYITLTARSMNPDLFIVARASDPRSPERLYRAGADRVISPYLSSGRHMAMLAVRPRVVDYLEIVGQSEHAVRLEELLVDEGSRLEGSALGDAAGEATPLVLRRADGVVIPHPARSERLEAGDLVLLLGGDRELPASEGS